MIKYKNFIITDVLKGVSKNQCDLFTREHVKHDLEIEIIDNLGNSFIFETTFQFNPKYYKFKKNDGLQAVILDALAFGNTRNYEDFCTCFGYEREEEKSYSIYRACEKAYNFFRIADLSLEDLNKLADLLDR